MEIQNRRNRAEIIVLMCELPVIYQRTVFVPAQEASAIMSTLPYDHNENSGTYCDHGRFLSSITHNPFS